MDEENKQPEGEENTASVEAPAEPATPSEEGTENAGADMGAEA